MIGAIIGDFVGSAYEFAPTKNYNFQLVTPQSSITDDTIMSLAVADALMTEMPDYEERMRYWGRKYPHPKGGYGGSFAQWLQSSNPQPYNSFGNGAAMRVSAVGWCFETMPVVLEEALQTAIVSHDHPEGIKGAQVVAGCVWLARHGYTKKQIKDAVEIYSGYDLSTRYSTLKDTYKFDETCQGTVPAALVCFLESANFVDCIRLAVALGGDADTLACIAGAIAEAYYGTESIPAELVQSALASMPSDLLEVYFRFTADIGLPTYKPTNGQ